MSETSMKRLWLAACAIAVAALAPLTRADTMMLEVSATISGTQAHEYRFSTSTAGSLNVKLADLGWPERLGSLSFALTTATSTLARLTGEGELTIDLDQPGKYYALVSGIAQGHFDLGYFSLAASFRGVNEPAPVPLPAAAWLMVLGLAGLASALRTRAPDLQS